MKLLRSVLELLRIWLYIVLLVLATAVSLAVLDPSGADNLSPHYSTEKTT